MAKRVKLRQRDKFRGDRSNRRRDMAIFGIWRFFDFSKMAAVRHLGFVMCVFDHPRRVFGGLYRCAKFGWNRCSSFDNMHVFRFPEFGLKTPLHAPKIGFFWDFTP